MTGTISEQNVTASPPPSQKPAAVTARGIAIEWSHADDAPVDVDALRTRAGNDVRRRG